MGDAAQVGYPTELTNRSGEGPSRRNLHHRPGKPPGLKNPRRLDRKRKLGIDREIYSDRLWRVIGFCIPLRFVGGVICGRLAKEADRRCGMKLSISHGDSWVKPKRIEVLVIASDK